MYNSSKGRSNDNGDHNTTNNNSSSPRQQGSSNRRNSTSSRGRDPTTNTTTRRYQFYVPTTATTTTGSSSSSNNNNNRGGDPPEIITPTIITDNTNNNTNNNITSGEEAAQKVRSRLIQLQKNQQHRSREKWNVDNKNEKKSLNTTNEEEEVVTLDDDNDDDEEECHDTPPPPLDSYRLQSCNNNENKFRMSSNNNNNDDEEVNDDDEDDEYPFNRRTDPIESDDEEKYYGNQSAPSSPVPISTTTDVYTMNCPSSAPLGGSSSSSRTGNRRGGQQSLRQVMGKICGKMGGQFKMPFDNINDDGGVEQRMLKKMPFHRNSCDDVGGASLQIGLMDPPPPPPPQQAKRVHRPPPKTTPQDDCLVHHEDSITRLHRPPPRQGVTDIKKGKYLTAEEAMNYVKTMASEYSRDTKGLGGGDGNGGGVTINTANTIHQAANDINKAYSFLNNMTNEEIVEYALTGQRRGSQPMHPSTSTTSASFDEESFVLQQEENNESDDDFERSTSLSMHAEEKFATNSRYAEDKLGKRLQGEQATRRRAASTASDYDEDEGSISISEREGGDVMHQMKEFHSGMATSKVLDHHVSDSYLYHGVRRGKSKISDPPSGNVSSGSVVSSSVLEKNTADQGMYGVETVIPNQYRDNYSGQSMTDVHQSASFQGSRRRSSDYSNPPEFSYNALGPRNKKPGGVTGVSLGEYDDYSENKQQYHEGEGYRSPDSFSEHSLSDDENSIADRAAYSPSTEHGGQEVDAHSTGLMTMLCGHLLPLGIDNSMKYDDTFCGVSSLFVQNSQQHQPVWNNDDPDEPGYVVHRLTNAELNSVEYAFYKMITSYSEASAANNNFERDLEEAEMILDKEEERYRAEMKGTLPSPGSDIDSKDSNDKSHGSDPTAITHDEHELRDCVEDFPGIYPPGKGRPGELECFYLPIITNSQKTGFEPTKDLVLKPGTVFANNYLVQGELGSAAFSTAYRCVDLNSEEDEDGYRDEVCLKVIKNTKDYFDQSIDEIKILRLLKDTGKVQENNIVEMKSFFYHREHLVIVTELLRQNMYEFGKSIIESRGPAYFTRDRLSHITRQCLIALKFVHELGLMHCDIKPEVRRNHSSALVISKCPRLLVTYLCLPAISPEYFAPILF